jgi:P4 family phage/plasmid primase-like protien
MFDRDHQPCADGDAHEYADPTDANDSHTITTSIDPLGDDDAAEHAPRCPLTITATTATTTDPFAGAHEAMAKKGGPNACGPFNALEKLLGLAFGRPEFGGDGKQVSLELKPVGDVMRRVVELPVECFEGWGGPEYDRPSSSSTPPGPIVLRNALQYQLERGETTLTRSALDSFLAAENIGTGKERAGCVSYYNKCHLSAKPDEAPALFELVESHRKHAMGTKAVDEGEYETGIDLMREAGCVDEQRVTQIEAAADRKRANDLGKTRTPMTDSGNAELFAAICGDGIRYVTAWKSWIVWDGRRWRRDDREIVRKRAIAFVKDRMPRLASIRGGGGGDDDHGDGAAQWLKHCVRSQSRSAIESFLSLASAMLAVTADELDRDGWLFNVRNGTIDLRTGTLRRHRREDMLTKLAPVEFDPAASCPTWDAFLARVFEGKGELVDYVQRAIGYSMTGDTSEECFFILHGGGRNGKTTLVETVKHAMGDYALTAMDSLVLNYSKQSRNTDDEAALFGVRMAACSETNEGQRFDESKVKRLTGTSEITAMRKFEHPFTFPATHKIWLDCNHLPRINGTDKGIWSRVKTIPFNVCIPPHERDPQLKTKLRREASGILNWMIAGLLRWQRARLTGNEPFEVTAATQAYQTDNDDLGRFLAERTTIGEAERVRPKALFDSYLAWCDENGVERRMTSIALGRKLKERGMESKVNNGARWYYGLSISSAYADADAETDAADASTDGRPF